MWHVKISGLSWVVDPAFSQTADISYREGGSLGAFTPAGTITLNEAGAITSTPNPFVIDVSDSWYSVEVQAVNSCNEVSFTKTFDKP